MSELEPTFTVKAFLDGDDDAEVETANFADALELAVASLREQGYCVQYEVTLPDGKVRRGA